MEGYVFLALVLLSGLVAASLQLPLGSLLLLYHASLGKNVREKTKRLASSFISGVTLMNFLLLASACFLVSVLSTSGTLSKTSLAVLFGILVALGLAAWFFYYKLGKSTELWLPRRLAKFIDSRAKETDDVSEAFSLGILTSLAEILFLGPLIVVSADAILQIDPLFEALSLVLFTLLSVLPLISLRFALRNGKNVADVQRWRLKNKTFFRIFSGFGFIILAVFLLAFVILGGKV
ncbi:hypothetical protein IJ380_01960 [Candidatus Saccharibacteria bacterium]|nr:hypothetical protein [Candidatus Saccharibacteria bacterium]